MEESGGPRGSAPEQDRYLPVANISRIMKKALPANGKIAKDAKDAVQECVSEFISFITSEASDKCRRDKRMTICGDDLIWAMATLGYEDYIEPLNVYLARYRELEEPSPNWLELPSEVTAKILHKLGAFEILASARLVCPLWWKICKDPLMWRTIDLTNPFCYPVRAMDKFSRLAIQLSCGHLEDITIVSFGSNDEVLKCIADSGSRLRKMRLVRCFGISDEGLCEAVKKFPLLEELEITMNNLSKDTVELIGQCCLFLKLVKLEPFSCFFEGSGCNDVAFAIAKTMPELRRLELFRDTLNNDGLLAILDGCPHLEYLDLRRCSNVILRGSLKERCYKQIKDFYSPDYESSDCGEDVDDLDDYYYVGCTCVGGDWENPEAFHECGASPSLEEAGWFF